MTARGVALVVIDPPPPIYNKTAPVREWICSETTLTPEAKFVIDRFDLSRPLPSRRALLLPFDWVRGGAMDSS